MTQDISTLVARYAEAKRVLDMHPDEDDYLVLFQLASSIADRYKAMLNNRVNGAPANHLASFWLEVSNRHLLRVCIDPEVRQRLAESRRHVDDLMSHVMP